MGGTQGRISQSNEDMGANLASMADWHDIKNLNISGEVGDVVVATKYGAKHMLKQFGNKGAATATIICSTSYTTDVTIKVPVGGLSGKLPQIIGIKQTGTGDDLVLYFQLKE